MKGLSSLLLGSLHPGSSAHFVINGKFMADRMQGIVRYARELTFEFDKLLGDGLSVELAIPANSKDVPSYGHIKVTRLGARTGIAWEQFDLARYIRKKDGTCINLCNTAPLFCRPGITVVHDVMYRSHPEYYTTLRNKVSRLWHVLQYGYIAKHERKVITVSNFSRDEIQRFYPEAKGKIEVIPNGWQHVLGYAESEDWQSRYPYLRNGEYFFSLATLARNKNLEWIIEVARRNAGSIFAVAGKSYDVKKVDIPSNVKLLGYIEDTDACSLIKHCKAFLYPSLYEGFGIPPLEALALGAEVVSSNAASLPEILRQSVHYIDPIDCRVSINDILDDSVDDPDDVLSAYSWKRSAELLYGVVEELR